MGRIFTKGITYSLAFEARLKRRGLNLYEAHAELAGETFKDHKDLTAGDTSTVQLRRLGHPFARGATVGSRSRLQRGSVRRRGRHPRLPINKQTGRLHFAIQMTKHRSARRQFFDIGPTSAAGKSIWAIKPGGTKFVVDRGYWKEVKRRWRARNDGLIKAFTKN